MVVFPWLSDEQLTRDNPSRFRLVVHGNRVADAHHEYGSQSPHGTGDRIFLPGCAVTGSVLRRKVNDGSHF